MTARSATFNRTDQYSVFYHEAIQVLVCVTGNYRFHSISGKDMYGYLYERQFDPLNITANLRVQDDDSGDSVEFLFTHWINSSATYVLVVTTFNPGIKTSFSINGRGPGTITYAPHRSYIN